MAVSEMKIADGGRLGDREVFLEGVFLYGVGD